MIRAFFSESILIISLGLTSCFCEIPVCAQEKPEPSGHYVLPGFVEGTVLLKNGKSEETLLNYNKLSEEMIFEKNDIRMALANIGVIDTIYLGDRKFVPHEKIFFEVLVKDSVSLFVQHKCNILQPGNPSGYGGTSETGAARSISMLANSGNLYKLSLPAEYNVTDASQFWIIFEKSTIRITSINQIQKIFPVQAKEIKQFAKKNKVNVRDKKDLILLITKCNELIRHPS
jgi:hypothetical protein